MKFWPVAVAIVAIAGAWGETRFQVADHEGRLDKIEESEKVEQMQMQQAVIEERTKTIKDEQKHQRLLLEQILQEIKK